MPCRGRKYPPWGLAPIPTLVLFSRNPNPCHNTIHKQGSVFVHTLLNLYEPVDHGRGRAFEPLMDISIARNPKGDERFSPDAIFRFLMSLSNPDAHPWLISGRSARSLGGQLCNPGLEREKGPEKST